MVVALPGHNAPRHPSCRSATVAENHTFRRKSSEHRMAREMKAEWKKMKSQKVNSMLSFCSASIDYSPE